MWVVGDWAEHRAKPHSPLLNTSTFLKLLNLFPKEYSQGTDRVPQNSEEKRTTNTAYRLPLLSTAKSNSCVCSFCLYRSESITNNFSDRTKVRERLTQGETGLSLAPWSFCKLWKGADKLHTAPDSDYDNEYTAPEYPLHMTSDSSETLQEQTDSCETLQGHMFLNHLSKRPCVWDNWTGRT